MPPELVRDIDLRRRHMTRSTFINAAIIQVLYNNHMHTAEDEPEGDKLYE